MYFEIIIPIIIFLVLIFTLLKKIKKKYPTGYLEEGDATLESYKKITYDNRRYFYYSGGRIDLKIHPEFLRFRTSEGKEVLVEIWPRTSNLYLSEGKSMIAVFEFLHDSKNNVIAIPCLRKVDSILPGDSGDSYYESKTSLGVSWNNGYKIIPDYNLIGIVRYEGLQNK